MSGDPQAGSRENPAAAGTRKVLIVSPHFSPINAPDMQRVRLSLPYLRGLGWEPVVLAVAPGLVEGGVFEPLLEKTYPADTRVVRVGGISQALTRPLGIGSLWLRCGRALRAAGDRLLGAERFDAVLFSTTQFGAFTLGPRWKSRFGVPYVLDYQDPWLTDYYERTGAPPPGGRLKFAFSQWRARRLEPPVLRGASGVIAVSDAYGEMLARLHPGFDASSVAVLPFGASEADLEVARSHVPAELLVPRDDGNFNIVYAGRCGPDMEETLSLLFRAFRIFLAERPEEARRVRFHFVGTGYSPRPLGRDSVVPVARREGVEDFVSEHRYRVPYFDALSYLVNADALLALGSDDPAYSASKLYPYALAGRPMLVLFDRRSPVTAIARELGCGVRFEFGPGTDPAGLPRAIAEEWFKAGGMRRATPVDRGRFRPYSAEEMTRKLAAALARAAQG
jgi:glycosyltransferase involved in cell wall biosynthesis